MGSHASHACPICGREAPPRGDNPAFPFCSSACKLVDLGQWLDGNYRLAGPPVESSVDADRIELRPDKDEA
jgi:endogenous inhibitor of DNA gyrase (YacG/DUF329 family)